MGFLESSETVGALPAVFVRDTREALPRMVPEGLVAGTGFEPVT